MIKNYCSVIGWICIGISVLCALFLMSKSIPTAICVAASGSVTGLAWFVFAQILANQEEIVESINNAIPNHENSTIEWIVSAAALAYIQNNYHGADAARLSHVEISYLPNGHVGLKAQAVKSGSSLGRIFSMEASCSGPIHCLSSWNVSDFAWAQPL